MANIEIIGGGILQKLISFLASLPNSNTNYRKIAVFYCSFSA
jgi:hypothetical protein